VLYENLAWIPLAAVVTGSAADSVPVGVVDPTRAALSVDLSAARSVGSGPVPAGTVLWGEAYDADWSATAQGKDLHHVVTFGWANGYRLERPSSVGFTFDAQWERWVALAVALVVWLFVLRRWWTTRVRAVRVRRPSDARDRRERHDALTDVLDEDAFWWERV
jgi:hypothetical protein